MSFKLFFHNILGREEAEAKLLADGVDKTYLGRRSPLNADCYILSYQVNGKFWRFPVGSRGRWLWRNVDSQSEQLREKDENIRALRELLKRYQATEAKNIRDEIFDKNDNMI